VLRIFDEEGAMNHLAIAARDVEASRRFYCDYFGFKPAPMPGFLMGPHEFLLAIDEVAEDPKPPHWLHYGFHLASRVELTALYERMQKDAVPIVDPLKEQGRSMVYFCRDPAGLLVEVRSPS
jgi:catechol 2,3-dioxygenase-like lactoylglutathione lyase family enzyme